MLSKEDEKTMTKKTGQTDNKKKDTCKTAAELAIKKYCVNKY